MPRTTVAIVALSLIAAGCAVAGVAPSPAPSPTALPTEAALPAAPAFVMKGRVEVPDVPVDLVAADLDEDGNVDLITNSAESETGIVLLFGRGDGTFSVETIEVGKMTDVAAEDLDDDGHLDLVAAGEGGRVVVVLGAGDGTFGPVTEYLTGGLEGWWLEVADLNGDTTPEVLLTEFMSRNSLHSQRLVLFPGTGGGEFEPPITHDLPDVLTVETADLNADGNIDVVTGNSDKTVGVHIGDGSAELADSVPYDVGGIVFAIATGDFDGDGAPDIATGNSNSHSVSALSGDGAGALGEATTLSPAGNTHSVLLVDLDGDGHLDLLSGGYDETMVRFWHGTGDGEFTETADIDTDPSISRGLAAADMNNDGKLDLAVSDEATLVTIFLQQ